MMKKIIFFFLIISIFISCENKKNDTTETKIYKAKVYRYKRNLIFPDTIYTDSIYTGYIDYSHEFDAYTKKVNEEHGVYRLIDFNYIFNSELLGDDVELEKNVNERAPAFTINKIELKPIKALSSGTMYIQGYINDLVVFDTIENLPADQPLDGLEQKYFIRKKVIVLKK